MRRPVSRVALPREYLAGVPMAHRRTFSEAADQLDAAMRAFARAVNDMFAVRQVYTRRQLLELRLWETWYAVDSAIRDHLFDLLCGLTIGLTAALIVLLVYVP